MLRRLLLVSLLAFSFTGCRGDNVGDAGALPDHEVDPQILQDVVEAAYMVPGPRVRRAMRVNNFLRGVGLAECGGGPVPIDGTYDRYSQDLYPDLELIRERGFTETEQGYELPEDDVCPDFAPDSIASWPRWYRLIGDWTDLAYSLRDQDPGVAAEEPEMARCLRERTGLRFEEHDPTTFIRAMMVANVDGGASVGAPEHRAWATAYADCGAGYFGALADALLAERDAFVERNREVLTEFARDIAEAGYVP
jgi:hypothetical protein